jgi:hypothetical protein
MDTDKTIVFLSMFICVHPWLTFFEEFFSKRTNFSPSDS